MRNCSNGVFVVDEWNCESQSYFLTHLHSDHTRGLSGRWRRGPIYCSKVTARLLLARFTGFDESLLHILELGAPTIVELRDGSFFEVIAVDAGHCPGSIILVFHGNFGCIVHTGDFRWTNSDDGRRVELNDALRGMHADSLYVDNTFCHPMFEFPSQDNAAEKIIEIIRDHPAHDVVIGVDNLGKEELLMCIARALETKIWVWPQRLKTMHLLGLRAAFTTDTTSTRVRAVPRPSLSVECLKRLNELCPTIGILPTGCYCLCNPSDRKNTRKLCSERCFKAVLQQQQQQQHQLIPPFIHLVPYSLHCCFSELKDFIDFVQPKLLMGIVKSPPGYSIHPGRHLRQPSAVFGPEKAKRKLKRKRQRLRGRGTRLRTSDISNNN